MIREQDAAFRCEIDVVGIRDTSSEEEILEDAPENGVCAGSKGDHIEGVSLLTAGLALDFMDIAVGVVVAELADCCAHGTDIAEKPGQLGG